jgi:DNA-binding transcriptional LysR family regulator
VELMLGPIPNTKLVEAVVGGRVDAAFIYTRPEDDAALDYVQIETDDFFLALPAGHALARHAELRLADLKDQGFLWMARDSAPGVYDRMIAACQAGGLTPRIVQHVLSENTRLHLVAAGMGLTFVTSAFTNYLPEAVVARRVLDFSVPLALELVWQKRAESPALRSFIETVKALKGSTSGLTRLRSAG